MSSDRLGDWSIERELDRGPTWMRYLARRGAVVAELTILDADEASDPAAVRAFQRETALVKQLNHPHLVRFLEAGTVAGRPYHALEHLAGPSLERHLVERGPITWPQFLELSRQLASALKFAHDRGIWHGDLSPECVRFVSEPGRGGSLPLAKITGFGPTAAVPPPSPAQLTPYTPPECREGKPVGQRGDIFSLGALFVALLTGRAPTPGNPLAGLPTLVPNEFRVLLERMLDLDPSRRPPDGNTLCRQFDKAQASLAEVKPSEQETKEATAALVSQFVREELEAQSQGGPVQQFFNKPWVIIPLFLLCAGTLVWTFWPMSQEGLFRTGAALMKSEDPADWDIAFRDYLDPLDAKYPEHPYATQVAEFRNRLARSESERAAARAARWAGPMTEAQWAYQQGLRARQQGDEQRARGIWQALVDAFGEVATEGPWVRLATQRLEENKPEEKVAARKLEPVRIAQNQARQFRARGKEAIAERIEAGLKKLYADEPGVIGK